MSQALKTKIAQRAGAGRRPASASSSTTSPTSCSTRRTGPPSPTWSEAHDRARATRSSRRPPGERAAHRLPHRVLGSRAPSPASPALGAGLRPAHRPLLDRPSHLLRHARPGRRPDLRADRRPATDLLGQLPGQRRGHGLRAAHRPYRGRDPQLWRASRGIIANGMELFEASRIPFATIADYLARSRGLRPRGQLAAGPARRRRRGRPRGVRALRRQRALLLPGGRRRPHRGGRAEPALFELEYGDAEAAAAELRDAGRRACWPRPTICCAVRSRIESSWPRSGPGWRRSRSAPRPSSRMADLAAAGRLDEDGPSCAGAVPDQAASRTRARVRRRPGDDLVRPVRDDVPAGRGSVGRRRRSMRRGQRTLVAVSAALVAGHAWAAQVARSPRTPRCGWPWARPARPAIRVWDDIAAQFEATQPRRRSRDELPGR